MVSDKKKISYETPVIIPLGELVRGSGKCQTGSAEIGGQCQSGGNAAGGKCQSGTSAPTAKCQTGTFAGGNCNGGGNR